LRRPTFCFDSVFSAEFQPLRCWSYPQVGQSEAVFCSPTCADAGIEQTTIAASTHQSLVILFPIAGLIANHRALPRPSPRANRIAATAQSFIAIANADRLIATKRWAIIDVEGRVSEF
jgi:hypothetical protein